MKKTLNIVLAVAAAAALIVSCVFGVQKANLKKTAAELKQQLEAAESAKTALEQQLSGTESARAALKAQLSETESAAAAEKKELEDQVSELSAGKTALDAQLSETEAARAALERQAAEMEIRLEKTERALTAARSNACLIYASGDWSTTSFGTMDSEDGRVRVTPASVIGDGEYTVGLTFEEPAKGLTLGAVSIEDGETDFPGAFIRINAIRVNGQGIPFGPGYTVGEDGKTTRMYFYREWTGEEESTRRCWDGNIAEAGSVTVDPEAFAAVRTLEVDFSLMSEPVDQAVILFSNSDGSVRTLGGGNGGVTAEPCEIRGAGRGYRTKVTFDEPVTDMSLLALAVQHGEISFPGYALMITRMWVNGERTKGLEGLKGYTSSDDGTETRMNLYNEGVDAVPENARSLDGNLDGAAAVWINKADFASVKSIEIEFSYQPAQEQTEEKAEIAAGETETVEHAENTESVGTEHENIPVQKDAAPEGENPESPGDNPA